MLNDPDNIEVLNEQAAPEDSNTLEPQVDNPLFYIAKGKSVILEDGRTVEDAIEDIEDDMENHTHEAKDIITDSDHQFVNQEEKDIIAKGTTYTNDIPTYVEHGGVGIGVTFKDKTIKEMFDMILYPYVSPVVSGSVITPSNGGTFELGSTVTITKVRVTASIKSNKLIRIQVVHGTTVLVDETEDISNGGTFDFVVNYPIKANATLSIKVTDDTQSIVSKNTGTFTFVYPIYHGALNSDSTPTESQIKNLTKHIESKSTKTYSFTTDNERFIFAYPKSYGLLSEIYDQNNFNVTDTFVYYTVPITCLDGKVVEYYVYVSERSTVTNFNNKFQW